MVTVLRKKTKRVCSTNWGEIQMIFQNIIAQDEIFKDNANSLMDFTDYLELQERTKQLSLAVEEEIDKWVFNLRKTKGYLDLSDVQELKQKLSEMKI